LRFVLLNFWIASSTLISVFFQFFENSNLGTPPTTSNRVWIDGGE